MAPKLTCGHLNSRSMILPSFVQPSSKSLRVRPNDLQNNDRKKRPIHIWVLRDLWISNVLYLNQEKELYSIRFSISACFP